MYKNYKVIKEEFILALNGQGTLLEHEKSGARVFAVKNDDDNKAFNIIFRTPPSDDSGLPHILEHSVLCGSRKYPVKDPFVELAKGSLNTFLNAMTYPDKTMYPVASCNDKDFRNLVDVYMDAVLYPNIYKDTRILKQEGWHYELENIEADIIYNGVVYNEMKGASSSPEQVLFRQIQSALFPDHAYGYDSGGEPDAIPDLTQEQFLDFHKNYYHPSNSYIFIYGDLDVVEQLEWLDEAYLKAFDKIEVNSELTLVAPFEQRQVITKSYAVEEGSSTDKKSYLSYNVAFNKPKTHCESLGLEILEYLLLEAPGAPLKEALLALDIAEDIFGSYDSGLRQPTFSIVAKNANVEDEGKFIETIEKTLTQIAKDGLPVRKVEAAINYFEFKVREADFGQYPKGVIYSIKAMDNWLYGEDPFENFAYDQAFDELKKGVVSGCFNGLVANYLIDNPHCALLRLVPDPTMLSTKEGKTKDQLRAYKENLSKDEIEALVEETLALKAYQAEAATPEALATIPLLELSDIKKEALETTYEVVRMGPYEKIIHKTFTNNIIYGRLLFDFSVLSFDEVPYLSLLSKLLTNIDTSQYTYSQLSDEINLMTGGIQTDVNIYGQNNNPYECQTKFEVKFKCFSEKLDVTLKLVKEILEGTIFDDHKRILDLLSETKSRLSTSLTRSGHTAGINRSMSYFNIAALYKESVEGITFYKFIEDLVAEKSLDDVAKKLKDVLQKMIRQENLQVLLNTEERLMADATNQMDGFIKTLDDSPAVYDDEFGVTFEALNEGFKTASKVQYCALSGDFVSEGYEYTGYMKVLQTIMSLDYMWTEVRIKGGAYGGFAGFRRNGVFFLGSYRDPNLNKTYEIYKALPDFIRNLQLDDRELLKYIIGTISNMDTPLTPQMKGERALGLYLTGVDFEDEQRERDEVLTSKVTDLVDLADLVEKVIEQNNICVIGNESKIEEEQELLSEVLPLFK